MIEYLDALGYSNQVFVPTYDKNLAVIEPNENVCLCECFHKWDRLVFDYKQKKIIKGIESNINIEEFKLIHAYTLFTDGNCARKLSQKYGIPYIVAVRNTDVNAFFRLMPHLRRRGVQIMCDAAAVFFLSEAYCKQVFDKYIPREYWEVIKKKTHIIPNGIDSYWLENTPVESRKIRNNSIKLIYAGRIDRNKNIPTTQKAMEILRKQGYEITLSIVGKIKDEKEFHLIKKDPFTTYYPAMSKERLIELYRSSDIFVMASFTESFGLVYAEAMSQNLPVIYTKGQGFDNQFDEGVVGYHVSAKDPEDVAEGIKCIIDNYSEIQKNLVRSAGEFSWTRIVEKYDRIYKAINR
jgi:glycosyltransferase involved in cell wall biosynthesis